MDLIQIRQNESVLVLHGAGIAAPFRGARCTPEKGTLETVLQKEPEYALDPVDDTWRTVSEIELALEGTALQIEAGLARLGCLLEEARRWASAPGGERVYLEARVTPGSTLWRSRLTGGAILQFAGADARALGVQAVRLLVERLDWWEGPEIELPLSNPNGTNRSGGLEINNAWDAALVNYVDIAANISGADGRPLAEISDLPAPLTLDFDGFETDATGTLYAFENITSSPGALFPVIEGESGLAGGGVTGTRIADSAACAGQFQRLTWSGESAVTAWTGTLLPETVELCAGRPFLPVARLAHPLYPSEKIWHFWRLTVSWGQAESVLDLPGCYLPIASAFCPGVPIFLPPWPVAAGAGETTGMGIELHAQAAGTGSHQIDLDALYLLPLDGWRIYRPALITWGSALKIHDDPGLGTLRAGEWNVQAHTAEGPGLRLAPGRAARIHFLAERQGGGFAPATRSRVRLFCRPRRRAL